MREIGGSSCLHVKKNQSHTFITVVTFAVSYTSGSSPASAQALFSQERDTLCVLHHHPGMWQGLACGPAGKPRLRGSS